jgi:cytochrome c oxidase assembly protein subunit 11
MLSRKGTTVIGLLAILGVMGTLTAYSVELYEIFCRVTGFGGTTQIAAGPADRILDRRIKIRFNADINAKLPWRFQPVQKAVTVRVGEQTLAFYQATSLSDEPVVGTATFNVTPAKAGQYFNKIDCFCFTEQTLEPGQTVDMPVQFFVDPAIADDRNLDDVKTITLSYTFFRAPNRGADKSPRAAKAPAFDITLKTNPVNNDGKNEYGRTR